MPDYPEKHGIQEGDGAPNPRPTHPDDDDDVDDVRIDRPPDNHTIAIWSHVGGFLLWILIPLVFYLAEKDKRSLAAWHARESLNFQLSIFFYYFLPVPLLCLMYFDLWLIVVPIAALLLMGLLEVIAITFASLAAWRGERFRYPLTISFVPRPKDEPSPFADDE